MLKSLNPTAIQSQECILQSLLARMNKNPYSKITISQICKYARLDRRTFYRNFKNKDDVLDFYIYRLKNEYIEMLIQKENLNSYNIAVTYFEFWNKHLDFFTKMNKDGKAIYLLNKQMELLPEIHNYFSVQSDTELSKYHLAYNVGGFWNLLINWASGGAKETPEYMASIVSSIILKH